MLFHSGTPNCTSSFLSKYLNWFFFNLHVKKSEWKCPNVNLMAWVEMLARWWKWKCNMERTWSIQLKLSLRRWNIDEEYLKLKHWRKHESAHCSTLCPSLDWSTFNCIMWGASSQVVVRFLLLRLLHAEASLSETLNLMAVLIDVWAAEQRKHVRLLFGQRALHLSSWQLQPSVYECVCKWVIVS